MVYKFRNKKTGETFENISEVRKAICKQYSCTCDGCPLHILGRKYAEMYCDEVFKGNCFAEHEEEILSFIGVEKVAVEPPRICEVLGVSVGEWFSLNGLEYSVTENGLVVDRQNTVHFQGLTSGINHPEKIIRKPVLTEKERTTLNVFKIAYPDVKYLARSANYLFLTDKKPIFSKGGICRDPMGKYVNLPGKLFPNLSVGSFLQIDEAFERK